MKNVLTLGAGTLAVLAASPAHADDGFELGGFGGIHLYGDNNELGIRDAPDAESIENAFIFGARLGYNFLSRFGVEGELGIAPSRTDETDVSMTAFHWRVNGLMYLLDGDVRPFALVGLGGQTASSENPDIVPNDTDFVAQLGLGAKFQLGESWGARADGRWLLPPSSATDSVTSDFEVLVGLYKTFGATDRTPAAPAEASPDPDRDGDGILDADDACPAEAEDFDGDRDDDGCPDGEPLDRDDDGVEDAEDACPSEPETVNGYEDRDGCPDTVPERVQEFTGTIEGIRFETGSATIAPSSSRVLDRAAEVLLEYPDLRVEIGGHTDNSGSDELNRQLSDDRANAVKDYLVAEGVAAGRLRAVGYGPDRPIADNDSPEGRAENRRVEFTLVDE